MGAHPFTACSPIKRGEASHLRLVFDGSALFLHNLKRLRGRSELFRTASGNKTSEPIPPGNYWIQTDAIHAVTLDSDWTPKGFSKPTLIANEILSGHVVGALWNAVMTHMDAWGEYRIPIRQTLIQQSATKRQKMFIHGGATFGSAGCIDIGEAIVIFVNYLRAEHPSGIALVGLDVVRPGS